MIDQLLPHSRTARARWRRGLSLDLAARPITTAVVVCLALAALSLLLPSEPSYDPWAWMVWGRELVLLDLDTVGGPSWKPLPVLVTALLSPLSKVDDGIPPALWLVIARAGGLLALFMAFRLAGRLAGGPRPVRYGAGVLAVVALLITPLWLRYLGHGNEAPMTIFFLLWGIERHLDGDRRLALALGFVACLLRPEVAPFLGAYGAWILWRVPELRKLAVGLGLALPVLWLVPEWIGSGNPLGAGRKATGGPPWSLSLRDQPWLAALERAHTLLGLVLEVGVVAAVALALRRRERAILWLTGAATAWVGLIVVMTEAGFSGNSRYFLVPLAIACVVGAAGAGKLVNLGRRPAAQVAMALVVVVGAGLYVEPRLGRLEGQARSIGKLVQLQNDLETSVERAGGPARVAADGYPAINRGFVTRMAWEIKVPIARVERARGDGMVFAARSRFAGKAPKTARRPGLQLRVLQGRWRVYVPRGDDIAAAPGG